jgi:hypothetical protein
MSIYPDGKGVVLICDRCNKEREAPECVKVASIAMARATMATTKISEAMKDDDKLTEFLEDAEADGWTLHDRDLCPECSDLAADQWEDYT